MFSSVFQIAPSENNNDPQEPAVPGPSGESSQIEPALDKAEQESTKESDISSLQSQDLHFGSQVNTSFDTISQWTTTDSDIVSKDSSEYYDVYSKDSLDVHQSTESFVPVVEIEVVNQGDDSEHKVQSDDSEKESIKKSEDDSKVDEKTPAKKPTTKSLIGNKKMGVKNVKKLDSNKVTSKIDNKATVKTPTKKIENVDNKNNSSKKVGSRIAEYIKEDPSNKDNNAKLSKNVVNRRKASMPDVKKTTNITVMPVSVQAKDRRMSMPAKSVAEEGDGKKPIKRSQPKSKWDNIMSGINNGKDAPKTKPKTEVKSRLNTTKSSTTAKSPTTGKPSTKTSTTPTTPKKSPAETKRLGTPVTPKPRTGMCISVTLNFFQLYKILISPL